MRPVGNVRYDFEGEVVIVTGAARGQGRSHALSFAEAGADVVIVDIGEGMSTVPYDLGTADQLNEVAAEVEAKGVRCMPKLCDVRSGTQVETVVAEALKEFGRIDVLVSNAGVESLPLVVEMTEEAWDEVVDTSLKGAFLCSKAVAPAMIGAGKGRVVLIASTASVTGLPRQAHYSAAKHGLVGFAKAFACEVAEHGITVNVVSPGPIETPMVKGILDSPEGGWLRTLPELTGTSNLFAAGQWLDSQEITNAVFWLSSDAARYVTGTNLIVDAGGTIK